MRVDLAPDYVRSLLDYDPDSGLFHWRPRGNAALDAKIAKKVAGSVTQKGYIVISIDGWPYQAHRLAWLWMKGTWPANEIDHKNLDRSDNSWANLRAASRSNNRHNQPRARNNTSGFKGVTWNKAHLKWQATIKLNRKSHYLGLHETAELAHEAYCEAAGRLHGDFARTG